MLQPDVPEEPKPEPFTAEAQVIAEMAVSGDLHPTVYGELIEYYWIEGLHDGVRTHTCTVLPRRLVSFLYGAV